ncbi:MAG: phosphoribosyltransferase family protein [Candidatus Acidiferrales bacterium]
MAIVNIRPMKLPPTPWVEGYILDYHTVSSTPTGDPYYRFDTKRTELGELLFRMKYRAGGNAVLADIIDTVADFVARWDPPIDSVVPSPPSEARKVQPSVEIAQELAKRLGLPVYNEAVIKVKTTQQMKNIDDWSERQRVLAEAMQPGRSDVKGRSILLFDDLIESGSTLRRAADVLLEDGGAQRVYALVLTRTK